MELLKLYFPHHYTVDTSFICRTNYAKMGVASMQDDLQDDRPMWWFKIPLQMVALPVYGEGH